MAYNDIKNILTKIKGYGIIIEAVFLSIINIHVFGDHKSIIDLIISQHVSESGIFAILTVLLLSLSFIYYIGYYVVAIYYKENINIGGGGTLSQHILPYGGIFILAIFIYPLMIYLSSPQLSDIQKFIIITFGFVFLVGSLNEYLFKKYKLQDNPNGTPPLDKQIKEIQERLNQIETRQKEQEKRLCLLEGKMNAIR
ncbi:MAG: hypothetical protein WA130_01325 [Candidatus Methanoperedens sp.]